MKDSTIFTVSKQDIAASETPVSCETVLNHVL